MNHIEQVEAIKKALDLTIQISEVETRLQQSQDEKFRAMPQAPVRQLVPKRYPKVSTKYKKIDWIISILPAVLTFLYFTVTGKFFWGIPVGLMVLVTWTVLYFIYRFMYYQFVGKKMLENSHTYREKRAEVDRDIAQKQSIADEKYLKDKRHYNEVVVPQYYNELSEWERVRNNKIVELNAKLTPLKVELQNLYESTKIIPMQYRNEAALQYLYDVLSTSDYDIKEAIELYDRKMQRDVEEARLREQRRQAEAMAEANDRVQYAASAYDKEPSGGGLLRHAVNAALDPDRPKKPSPYKDFMGAVGCQYGIKGYCLGCKLYHQCIRGAGK